jgi:serine/threonine protein kinase/tetratricopeptide (TPR) repeat protein
MATQQDNWEAVKALFEAALALDAANRHLFLKERCADASLRAEVERLLAEHDEAASFLSAPALVDVPREAGARATRLSDGEVLAGRFRIIRFIASGGMGEVYEAEDQELRERVAVKIIRPEILAQPNAIGRFKREVHLARKVTHPNVCRVFDLFRHRPEGQEETVFISMELLQGQTLEARLKAEGRVNVGEALPLLQQMASALAAAHAVGIVHRDFKPGTVVLVGVPGQQRERAVVTDFGLALRSVTSDETASLPTGQGLLGTPAYMSPEQIEGRQATAASDIYALGLVIYEMVTGQRPFQGDTPMSAAMKRLSVPPTPPRNVAPELSPAWEAVILRCLEREPAKRFSNAEEVAGAILSEYPGLESGIAFRKAVTRQMTAALVAVPLIVVLIGGGLYYRAHQSKSLTDKDTIVLADFANATRDAVFDDTLKTALNISLQQSPFLSVVSDTKVMRTLQMMTRPPDTKLTPAVTREVCRRAGSKAYVAGSIGSLGSEYVLGLKAVNCQTGDLLAQEQVTAGSKEKVLDALGEAASRLRGKLGESLATVHGFDVPLEQATTSSFEALKMFSLGRRAEDEKGPAAALHYDQRAIEIDPDFAMGQRALGTDYYNLGEFGRASEYFIKAFQLREHASEWEKLGITADYYADVTGELDKGAQAYQEETETFPRQSGWGYSNLGSMYAAQGQYEGAIEITRQAGRLAPDDVGVYESLAYYGLAMQRFDEARQLIHEAEARKLDDYDLHAALYNLAFLGGDSAAMAEQLRWFASKREYEAFGAALASDTEAYVGHLRRAGQVTGRAVDAAIRADNKESGAILQAIAAQREAAYGEVDKARQLATEALTLAPASQGAESEAALAFALAGDTVQATSLARDLNKRHPLDTQIQALWLPAIQAQTALDNKDPALARNVLQVASPIELGQIGFVANISCLYQVYVRGEAYLAAGQGHSAAAEFQIILDHNGIVWNCWTGALARLGVARANALQMRTSQGADADAARVRALAAYKDFLTLWKDADPDIPILKEAKAEYAKLH